MSIQMTKLENAFLHVVLHSFNNFEDIVLKKEFYEKVAGKAKVKCDRLFNTRVYKLWQKDEFKKIIAMELKKKCQPENSITPSKEILPEIQKLNTNTDDMEKRKVSTNEKKLRFEDYELLKIRGDGNCLYRALSFRVYGHQENHHLIRQEIVRYVKDNWDEHYEKLLCTCVETHYTSFEDYEKVMGKDKVYGTDFEISMFSNMYGYKVKLYGFDKDMKFKMCGEFIPVDNEDGVECVNLLFTGTERGGHFDILQDKNRVPGKKICKDIQSAKNLKNGHEKKTTVSINEKKLHFEDYELRKISEDGNCLYRALSFRVYGHQENHHLIRQEIVRYVKDNWDEHYEKLLCTCVEKHYTSIKDYEDAMGKDNVYGTDFEISMFANLYEYKVKLYGLDENLKLKMLGEFIPIDNDDTVECLSLLFTGTERGGHFDFLQEKKKICIENARNLKNGYEDFIPVKNISTSIENEERILVTKNIEKETVFNSIKRNEINESFPNVANNENKKEHTKDSKEFLNDEIYEGNKNKQNLEISKSIFDFREEEDDSIIKYGKLNTTERMENNETFMIESENENYFFENESVQKTEELITQKVYEGDKCEQNEDDEDINSDSSYDSFGRHSVLQHSSLTSRSASSRSASSSSETDTDLKKETDKKLNNDDVSKEQKVKIKSKKNVEYKFHIGSYYVPRDKWKNLEEDHYSRDAVRESIKMIMQKEIKVSCPLSFNSLRENDTAKHSIVAYAKCNEGSHTQHFRFEINDLQNPTTLLIVRSDSEIIVSHKEKKTLKCQQIRGEERQKAKKILNDRSARDFYHDRIKKTNIEMWDKGHPQGIVRVNTIHKMKEEINKSNRLELESLNLQDLFQLFINEKKLNDPYIQSVGLPLRVVMFTRRQIRAIIEDKNVKIAHMDATGAFVRRPYDCHQVYYYCIICRLMESVIPAAEMITCEHDVPSISKFLKDFRYSVQNLYKQNDNIWPLFEGIAVDWSWALINSILFEWNEMSIERYLQITYDYLSEGKKPPAMTILLICVAHLLHTVSRNIKKNFPELESRKQVFLDFFSLLLLCKNLTELDAVYEDLAYLLLTKDKIRAQKTLLALNGAKFIKKEELSDITEEYETYEAVKEELITEAEFDYLYEKSTAIYSKSPFFKRYYTKFILIESTLLETEATIETEDITNELYAPKFLQYVTLEFMPYISICGASMLNLIDKNISRVSNAFVESHNKVIKHSVLKNQKRNPIGQVVRKLKENVEILVKQASLETAIGEKMNLHSKQSPLYPGPEDNPFIKEMWKDGKDKKKKREHFKVNSLKRMAKKVIEDNEEELLPKKELNKQKQIEKKMNLIPQKPENKGKKFRKLTDGQQLVISNSKPAEKIEKILNAIKNEKDTEELSQKRKRESISSMSEELSSLELDGNEEYREVKIMKNNLHLSRTDPLNDIKYYGNSQSPFIKIGKYYLSQDLPSTCKEIDLTCQQFNTILDEKGLINGLLIDVYNSIMYKNWKENVTFFVTDDTRTMIGDYDDRRRLSSFSIYSLKTPIKEILLLPYVLNIHWRILIVDIIQKSLTLLDPYEEATDKDRVFNEFENFLKLCKKNSSFAQLKTVQWERTVFGKKKPHQSINDAWNCGLYVIYYMECIATDTPLSEEFNPAEYRNTVAEIIIKNKVKQNSVCKYCLTAIKHQEETASCSSCLGEIHNMCILKVDNTSQNEDLKSYSFTYSYICKLCRMYKA